MVSKSKEEIVLERQKHRCNTRTCKKNLNYNHYQVDHIITKAEDGTDDLDNLQALCLDCHEDKTRIDNKRNSLKRKPNTQKKTNEDPLGVRSLWE